MNAFSDYADFIKTLPDANPWQGTPFENFYNFPPKKKGVAGEEIVKQMLSRNGHKVEKRVNTGHDAIIDGVKTEIKFSLATERNYDGKFTFNHIGLKKDWEQIIFVGVNGDGEMKVAKFWKNDLPLYLFTRQSGGNYLSNDDWMITKEQSTILFSLGS